MLKAENNSPWISVNCARLPYTYGGYKNDKYLKNQQLNCASRYNEPSYHNVPQKSRSNDDVIWDLQQSLNHRKSELNRLLKRTAMQDLVDLNGYQITDVIAHASDDPSQYDLYAELTNESGTAHTFAKQYPIKMLLDRLAKSGDSEEAYMYIGGNDLIADIIRDLQDGQVYPDELDFGDF